MPAKEMEAKINALEADLKARSAYIAEMEKLVNGYAALVRMFESELKDADSVIRAHEIAEDLMTKDRQDADRTIQAQEEIQKLSLVERQEELQRSQQTVIEHQQKLAASFSRFVPQEFLKYLKCTDISEVRLGDNVHGRMSILFADIRSFTDLSEKMTPQENFRFLNSYLKRIGPVIRKHGGFIDKYIGDAVMALFPAEPADALRAAVDIQKQVAIYNGHRMSMNYAPISVGIGVHLGDVILGTIGEENRMETTVISSAVNAASRMESITKYYGAGIMASERLLSAVPDRGAFTCRVLDRVMLKGISEPLVVVEILDGQEGESLGLKIKTRSEFEAAVGHYQAGEMEKAEAAFKKISGLNPRDKAAGLYIDRVKYYRKHGVPEDWEGIEVLGFK